MGPVRGFKQGQETGFKKHKLVSRNRLGVTTTRVWFDPFGQPRRDKIVIGQRRQDLVPGAEGAADGPGNFRGPDAGPIGRRNLGIGEPLPGDLDLHFHRPSEVGVRHVQRFERRSPDRPKGPRSVAACPNRHRNHPDAIRLPSTCAGVIAPFSIRR